MYLALSRKQHITVMPQQLSERVGIFPVKTEVFLFMIKIEWVNASLIKNNDLRSLSIYRKKLLWLNDSYLSSNACALLIIIIYLSIEYYYYYLLIITMRDLLIVN